MRESVGELTSFDSRIWRSLRTLIRFPGQLTTAWIEGRRQSFTRPLRLFLIAVLLLAGSSAIWRTEGGFLSGFLQGAMSGGPEPDERAREAAAFLARTIQWFGLALVPVAAGIVACFYRRRPFSVHLVTVLHIFTFAVIGYVAFLNLLGLISALGAPGSLEFVLGGLLFAVVVVHVYRTLAVVYGSPPFVTFLKAAGIVVGTLVLWVAGAVLWVTARSL
ncbi:MAG: DUF3667 domain-containing protein [Acidimicrobiia bacterium]|nr:DUF3667 domain-containing protein [Acidimicrobiia bacterium]